MTNDHSPSIAPRAHAISKTAVWVAAGRAIGAREPDLQARNPDRLAEALLGDPARLELNHPIVDALHSSYEQARHQCRCRAGLDSRGGARLARLSLRGPVGRRSRCRWSRG